MLAPRDRARSKAAARSETWNQGTNPHSLGSSSRSCTVNVAPPPGGRVVVHFHGNGSNIEREQWFADVWRAHGFGFLAVEYPGYDGVGEPTEAGLFAAAEKAVARLEARVGRDNVVLEGQSLGTGVAVHLAALGHGSRLLLLSPYTSIVDVYKHQWNVAEAVLRLRREGMPVTLDLVGPAYPPAPCSGGSPGLSMSSGCQVERLTS